MSETSPQTRAAKHLRQIENLYPDLAAQAAAKGADKSMPGGDAMVMMSPGADLAAYRYRMMSALMGRINVPHEETSGDPDSVLQVLAYWADEIRAERGELTDLPATVKRCTDYIRQTLDWAFSVAAEEFDAEAMTADLARLRTRMEAVLRDGYRPELGVPCMYTECGGQRIRRDIDHHGNRSEWYCPNCQRHWDDDRYLLNVKAAAEAAQSEWIDGQLWTTVKRAASHTGVNQNRIRMWIKRGYIETQRLDRHRRLFVSVDQIASREESDA